MVRENETVVRGKGQLKRGRGSREVDWQGYERRKEDKEDERKPTLPSKRMTGTTKRPRHLADRAAQKNCFSFPISNKFSYLQQQQQL